MAKKKVNINKAAEMPPVKKYFFTDKNIPDFAEGDKFMSKGQVFIIKDIDAKGIYAVLWPEEV
ncbi:MAG: hypothetical protein ACYSTI_13985 [Planctomycetota bacterium]|jgi:hypothetical protein